MSKQDFTDTLLYGKCKCGNPGTAGKTCYSKPTNDCNCCAECFQSCVEYREALEEILVKMAQTNPSTDNKADDDLILDLKDLVALKKKRYERKQE